MTKKSTKQPAKADLPESTNVPATKYEPTPEEQDALDVFGERRRRANLNPRIRTTKAADGRLTIAMDHPDEGIGQALSMNGLATADGPFYDGILGQLINASSHARGDDERGLNFMFSLVRGVEPQDAVETMLAAQMAAVHNATMTFARRLNHVDNIPQQDSAERAFNKLARTFASQVEALKRYRSSGEQKMTVEHVTVNEGGQAIVGNVTQRGGVTSKKEEPTS